MGFNTHSSGAPYRLHICTVFFTDLMNAFVASMTCWTQEQSIKEPEDPTWHQKGRHIKLQESRGMIKMADRSRMLTSQSEAQDGCLQLAQRSKEHLNSIRQQSRGLWERVRERAPSHSELNVSKELSTYIKMEVHSAQLHAFHQTRVHFGCSCVWGYQG